MRIPCAKCGHLHDSTVTPFMHDIVREDGGGQTPLTESIVCGKYKTASFKCGRCGSTNNVFLMWSVTEKKEAANVPEDTDRVL